MSEASYKANNPSTTDNRQIVAINRIPAGFTIYPTGQGDDLTANGLRAGPDLIFDANNKVIRFQMCCHWYGIGGRVVWEGADLGDSMNAFLKAPATVGTNSAGDYNKVDVGGYNIFVPAAPTTGAWTLDITEKHTGTDVLKCVPVPAAGNTGYFDYDSDTNVLTVNSGGTGGYHLLDIEVSLFCFANKIYGRKQDGSESSLEIPDVVGKLLFNSWVVEFTLVTAKTDTIKTGMVMITAVKGNV